MGPKIDVDDANGRNVAQCKEGAIGALFGIDSYSHVLALKTVTFFHLEES